MGPLASALGVSPQELLILFAQGQIATRARS